MKPEGSRVMRCLTIGVFIVVVSVLVLGKIMEDIHHPVSSVLASVHRSMKGMADKLMFPVTYKESTYGLNKVVLVTAADSSHFEESRDAIASIQKNIADTHKVFYYDIGLTQKQADEVKHWCRVQYVKFNFSKYPKHVSIVKRYAWKTLIIKERLQKHGGVIWFDACERIMCADFMKQFGTVMLRSGIASGDRRYHSTYAVTHPGMYKYWPVDMHLIKTVKQYGTDIYGMFNTTRIVRNVIDPMVKCVLTPECNVPVGSEIPCHFGKDKMADWAKCHRHDQSMFGIAMTNLFGNDTSPYDADSACDQHIRKPTKLFTLQICKSRNERNNTAGVATVQVVH